MADDGVGGDGMADRHGVAGRCAGGDGMAGAGGDGMAGAGGDGMAGVGMAAVGHRWMVAPARWYLHTQDRGRARCRTREARAARATRLARDAAAL